MKVKVSQVGSEGLSSRAEAVELLNFFDFKLRFYIRPAIKMKGTVWMPLSSFPRIPLSGDFQHQQGPGDLC